MKCHGCGVEKDFKDKEKYPYPEDILFGDAQIDPLFQIDCQPYKFNDAGWKRVTICHNCFHKLQPDMWISRDCWESINPVVPFNELPDMPEGGGQWELEENDYD